MRSAHRSAWEEVRAEDAGGSLRFLLQMDMLSASNCYCWLNVFCMSGTSWDPLTRSGLRTIGEVRSYSSPSFIQTGQGKFRVTAWHGWWIRRRVSVWWHPACPSIEVCNVSLDNGWKRLETCPKNGVLEGMMKNDHFSQSKELLIKLPASFAQGWPREHWLL